VRFLVDTNVLSELRKGDRSDAGVREWFGSVVDDDLALSVLAVGEIRLGILRLRRRDAAAAGHLDAWLTQLEAAHARRLLPVDRKVVRFWAEINAARPLPVVDSLQAATALAHGLTFVTRNVKDLGDVAVPLLNPFSG